MTLSRLRALSGKPNRHSFRFALSFSQRAHITTFHRSQSKLAADLTNQDNDYLRLIFDDRNVWEQHRKPISRTTTTGLFRNPHFVNSDGLDFAAKQSIQRAQIIVERICNAPENGPQEMRQVVKNLDRLSDTLCSVIDIAEFLRNAHPQSELMEAANRAYADLCSYMNTLNTDTRIHAVLSKVMADQDLVAHMAPDEHAAAVVFLRDFEKSGIHLPTKQREEFVRLSDQIIHLGREFIQHNPRSVPLVQIKASSLSGVGPSLTRGRVVDGCVYVQTNSPECQLILKYANDGSIRRQIYEAVNSATEKSIATLENLLKTRADLSTLVGRTSFAELQLQDKMAKHPNNVDAFLRTLLKHQAAAAKGDVRLLQETMQRDQQLSTLPTVQAWDRDYYVHMATLNQKAAHRPMPPMPYFSVGSVIQGLSLLFSRLYGIHFESASMESGESWHDDVRKLDVVCEQEGIIGTIYCDLFTRPGKTTHAAHYTVRTSRRVDDDDAAADIHFAFPHHSVSEGQFFPPVESPAATIRGRDGLYQLPVVALTCDFASTPGQKATLLSMFDVETLFHEMGHAMHSMIGRTNYHNVAGTRCATDFVELPSILMEHFVWHPAVMPLFARDPHSAAPLSTEAVSGYLQQRHRFGGIDLNSQILMALIDQKYHSADVGSDKFSSEAAWYALQDDVGLFPSTKGAMWPVQFGHLFGYGAGYYSYLFDRTLARRIWKSCFEANPLDRNQGQIFRDNLLRWGGGRDPWQCVASVLGGEDGASIVQGDEQAMRTVGDWGIET